MTTTSGVGVLRSDQILSLNGASGLDGGGEALGLTSKGVGVDHSRITLDNPRNDKFVVDPKSNDQIAHGGQVTP